MAEAELSDTVLVNNSLYRLLSIAITRHRLEATVALADFASYALTMDLLETELVNRLVAALLIQKRSARVLNVTGKLAVVPKAFHGPTVETSQEASLSASLEREFEEELLGREDLEYLSQASYREPTPSTPITSPR